MFTPKINQQIGTKENRKTGLKISQSSFIKSLIVNAEKCHFIKGGLLEGLFSTCICISILKFHCHCYGMHIYMVILFDFNTVKYWLFYVNSSHFSRFPLPCTPRLPAFSKLLLQDEMIFFITLSLSHHSQTLSSLTNMRCVSWRTKCLLSKFVQ